MAKIDLNKIKKIHFIGVGGIGLSAIAKLMLVRKKIVSGSDVNESAIIEGLKRQGANIFIGHREENLPDDCELLIYTLAVPGENPEVIKAKNLKIPVLSYPEALAVLFNDKFGIAICGTHGKSTTTSLMGLILADGGLDPSVVVGSKVPAFGGNLRVGNSDKFVIEACEYERAFLNYYPKMIILNNIELDHTDYYRDIQHYTDAFNEFISHLSHKGLLVLNGDDKQILDGIKLENFKVLKFGLGEDNDLRGYNIEINDGEVKFNVNFKDTELGEFKLKVPGAFNVYNALGAMAGALEMGVSVESIRKTLSEFSGIWRRFEVKGDYKVASAQSSQGRSATIVSDYAHHPTAVRMTIEAAREFYPGRRIFAVFQPHQHNRTKELYQDFLSSFDSADILILSEIFDVAGREKKEDQIVSSSGLADDIKKRISKLSGAVPNNSKDIFLQPDNIFYDANIGEARKMIEEKIKPKDVVLIMGAGDIYKIADDLVK